MKQGIARSHGRFDFASHGLHDHLVIAVGVISMAPPLSCTPSEQPKGQKASHRSSTPDADLDVE